MPKHLPAMILAVAIAGLAARAGAADAPADEAAMEFFEKEVRPLLAARCFECHGSAEKIKGGLRLNSRQAVIAGGESGPAAVPGKPDESLLVEAVHYKGLQMPPSGKLPEVDAQKLVRWIELGLPWPDHGEAVQPVVRRDEPFHISDQQRQFWSFQPLRTASPPAVQDSTWPATAGLATDVDRFVLASLEAKGLKPNPAADKRTLLRRATFDLTGLGPTPEEINAFLVDESPGAWERVIDRLLASPHYGERWGRHWLDVVRYADTAGETADYPVREAYLYRNYVIDSFQNDKPYDQFIREQLAGDLLARTAPREKYAENITATGYLAISRRFGFDPENYHHLTIADTIDTLGRSVLGLSIGCARCHDHKYDPLSSADYYALYGIFGSTRYAFPGSEEKKRPREFVPLVPDAEAAPLKQQYDEQLAQLNAEVKRLEDAKDPAAGEIKKQRDALANGSPYPLAYGVIEGPPANARIQIRGEPARLGEEVPRRFLEILGGDPLPADMPGSGRLQLADWLTRPSNPLTARVMVNRIWQHHFGKGLVQTPSDFGLRGRAPTHPELLDFLAGRFMAGGWSIKALHKGLMLSQAYQISSLNNPQATERDPGNDLIWRFERRRLDAESLRDALLAASGQLDPSRGGQHPFPPIETWGFTQHTPFKAVYDHNQRSIYLMTQRTQRHPFLALFDGADPTISTGQRSFTTTPTQALFLMNDPFVHAQSAALAQRALTAATDDPARLAWLHEVLWGRPPLAEEAEGAAAFLEVYRQKLASLGVPPDQLPVQAWAGLARVLLTSNNFLYVD